MLATNLKCTGQPMHFEQIPCRRLHFRFPQALNHFPYWRPIISFKSSWEKISPESDTNTSMPSACMWASCLFARSLNSCEYTPSGLLGRPTSDDPLEGPLGSDPAFGPALSELERTALGPLSEDDRPPNPAPGPKRNPFFMAAGQSIRGSLE